ncbi:unnamed protein product [Tetraodon nigroviridis]|uniref:(spotted green pufferfish) hypothetical protein n=1 Tax=Tetraodon nigroviridis TaxID=99883 RepID=Q4RKW1_TETNG|nr:unnamed protein product [Tetraodon nigroviridis]
MEYHWILLCVSLCFTFHPGKALEANAQLVAEGSDRSQTQIFCMATIIHAAALCCLRHASLFHEAVELELKGSDKEV